MQYTSCFLYITFMFFASGKSWLKLTSYTVEQVNFLSISSYEFE